MNIRKTLLYLFFLGLACVMMYFLYRHVSWTNDILPNIQTAKWPLVILSFVLGYSATVIRGLRWNVMLEPMGYRADNWTAIHSVAFGYSMNNLVPRSGELARCTLLNRAEKIPVDKLIGTVILERVVDMMLLSVVLFMAFVLKADAIDRLLHPVGAQHASNEHSGHLVWYLLIGGLVAFILTIYIMSRLQHIPVIKKIFDFLKGIQEGLKTIFKLKRKMLFVVYSVGIWTCWTLMTFSILKALQSTEYMTFSDTIFFMAAGSLGMIVPTPGGAGSFHGMSELAFVALGYEGKAGKIFALISWSAKTLFDIIIGFVGFFIVTSKKIKL